MFPPKISLQPSRPSPRHYELQVLYPTQVAKDLKTHGAIGSFTPDDALKAVLSGTGLSYKYLDAKTVTVFATAAPAGVTAAAGQDQTNTTQDNSKEAGKKSSQDFLVAQATQGQTSGPSTVEKQDEQASKEEGRSASRSRCHRLAHPRADIEQIQPVRSYTQVDIEESGRTTITDFLNALPDVSRAVGEEGIVASPGQSSVGLHGLPSGTTLLLLDGRRVELGNQGFFDLGNIPISHR